MANLDFSTAVESLLLLTPGFLLAILVLILTAKALRGSGRAALTSLAGGLLFLAALAVGAVIALREFHLRHAYPECLQKQTDANAAGEAVLLDCESLGLVAALPVMVVGQAVLVFLVGAFLLRMLRRR